MTLTISWWWLPIVLIIAPIVWIVIKRPASGDYGGDIMEVLIVAMCWFLAIGIMLGKFFF